MTLQGVFTGGLRVAAPNLLVQKITFKNFGELVSVHYYSITYSK